MKSPVMIHQNNLAMIWYPMASSIISMEARLSPCREGNVVETSQCSSLMQPVGRGDNYGQVWYSAVTGPEWWWNGIVQSYIKERNRIGNTVNARNRRVTKSIIPLARHYGLELQLRPNF